MVGLDSFLRGDTSLIMLTMADLENIRIDPKIVFLGLAIILPFFMWPFIRLERKRRKLKKELEKDVHAPGMESARVRLKSKLKKFDIKIDDQQHERN